MTPPLLITAFGTSTRAFATYDHLDKKLRQHFRDRQIYWAYSSRTITNQLQSRENIDIRHPREMFAELAQNGVKDVILQSLHLFPGKEFHSLVRQANSSGLNCSVGAPLLTSPDDYSELASLIAPLAAGSEASALLVLGHGTDHPIWVAYPCLENTLNRLLYKRVYVGVVEKYPDSSGLIDVICADGVKHLLIIPLFLVAGMHFNRDIAGQSKVTWRTRLQQRNIKVDIIDYGLGLLPGIDKLICRHISEAASR